MDNSELSCTIIGRGEAFESVSSRREAKWRQPEEEADRECGSFSRRQGRGPESRLGRRREPEAHAHRPTRADAPQSRLSYQRRVSHSARIRDFLTVFRA